MKLLFGIVIGIIAVLAVDVFVFDSGYIFNNIYSLTIQQESSLTNFDSSKGLQWQTDNIKYYIKTNGISDEKADIVENTISGTGSITNRGSISWQDALAQINTKYVYNNVPNKLERVEVFGIADIVIELSEEKKELSDDRVVAGFTTVSHHPLFGLKHANIILFNVDETNDRILQSVIRHEFGHALGLPHSQRAFDVMKEELQTENVEINEQTMNDLYLLYQ